MSQSHLRKFVCGRADPQDGCAHSVRIRNRGVRIRITNEFLA